MPKQFDMFADAKEVESKNDEYEEMQARKRALAAEMVAEAERVRKALEAGEDPYPESRYVDYCDAEDYIINTILDGEDPKALTFGDLATERVHSILEAKFYGSEETGEQMVNRLLKEFGELIEQTGG